MSCTSYFRNAASISSIIKLSFYVERMHGDKTHIQLIWLIKC